MISPGEDLQLLRNATKRKQRNKAMLNVAAIAAASGCIGAVVTR